MNPVELLKRLIAMPSVTPDAAGTLDLVGELLRGRGCGGANAARRG